MLPILILLYLLYGPLPSLLSKLLFPPKSEKLILSFDDGPSHITTDLLDLLKKYDEKAIFFLLEGEAKKHPFLVRRILDEGHSLGLHGSSHRSHLFLDPYSSYKEIRDSYKYLRHFGVVDYARLPYGRVNLVSLWTFKKYGLKHLGWDHLLRDWKLLPKGKLKTKLLQLEKGVVLLHDGTAGTADPLAKERMLDELKEYFMESHREKEKLTHLAPSGDSQCLSSLQNT